MTIQAILFDLDGVLIDSGEAHLESWNQLLREHGKSMTPDMFSLTFGRLNRDIIPLIWQEDVAPEWVEQLSERKEEIYRDLVRDNLKIIPGAVSLVRDAHDAGMRLTVGSSSHPLNIRLALDRMGVTECFCGIVSAADVQNGKPAPDVFLKAAERAGIDPRCCAVIEDAPAGIEAANAAGCYSIGLTSHHPADRLSHADRIVNHLSELSPAQIRAARPDEPGNST